MSLTEILKKFEAVAADPKGQKEKYLAAGKRSY